MLLFDEASSALDKDANMRLFNSIYNYQKLYKIPVFFVTHDEYYLKNVNYTLLDMPEKIY